MPTKDSARFLLYIPTKKTFFSTIKYELTIEFLSANGYKFRKREKRAHARTPLPRLRKVTLSDLQGHCIDCVFKMMVIL